MNNLIKQSLWSNVVYYWIGIGAISGAFLSGVKKCDDIISEPVTKYDNEFIERPIRGVYHTSRIAAYAGWGAAVGGVTAATAPVSIPAYMYWKNKNSKNNTI